MTQNIDLKKLEQKAWRSYSEDGFWGIFLGLLMLGTGIRTLTDNVWFTLVAISGIVILPVGKKFITVPRLGLVKFGQERKVKQKKAIVVTALSVVVTFVLLMIAVPAFNLSRVATAPILGILVALVFGLLAYYLDFRRLYIYGLLLAVSMALTEAFDSSLGPVVSACSGSIILLIGMVQLIKFVRTYPAPVTEVIT